MQLTSHLRSQEPKVRTTTVIGDSLTYNWRAPEDGGRVTEWKPRVTRKEGWKSRTRSEGSNPWICDKAANLSKASKRKLDVPIRFQHRPLVASYN